jgi:hypothetical protein
VVLTAIFYVHTISVALDMYGKDLGHNWKSSPWPLLFGGIELDKEPPKEEDDMTKVAEKLKVKLEWAEDGWKFREGF